MSDSFSSNLRVRLPQTGAYNNTWGAVLNSDALNFLDKSIAGQATIALTGLTYSMPALSDGSDSDSRAFCLKFTGAPGAAVVVTIPATVVKKNYLIDNQCGQTITFKYASSTSTVDVLTAKRVIIWCDGTDCFATSALSDNTTSLNGVDSAYWARTGRTAAEITAVTYLTNAYVNGVRNTNPWYTITEGAITTIDARQGNLMKLTLTGNRTMAAPTNVSDGQTILLYVLQDATGSRTLTWNSVFQFEQGSAPILTTTANHGDLFSMIYDSAATAWYVSHVGSNTGVAGGANYNLTIEENATDWNLYQRLGSPGSAVTVNLTINSGVVIQALSTGSFALDLSGLPSGSTVNLYNSGYCLAHGGGGGCGGLAAPTFSLVQSVGQAGGVAIKGPGVGRTFNVTNANGHIWGGGGGGGGGSAPGGATNAGGGGGGGAGGGAAGQSLGATQGTPGSTGINGALGAGGAASSGSAYAGGDGGTWGAAGSNNSGNAATGGTAGKAIELSGGAVTWVSGSGSPNVLGLVT